MSDLTAAAARFSNEFGLDSVEGGRHPAWGTANRLIPLGTGYVELTAVVDAATAVRSEFGRAVHDAVTEGGRLLTWSVATDDIEAVARRLSLDVLPGSRTKPDGVVLAWRLAGLAHSLRESAFPFFIQRDCRAELHPAFGSAAHRVKSPGIAWVEVRGNKEALRRWLGGHELPVRIREGESRLSAIGIATDQGEIILS